MSGFLIGRGHRENKMRIYLAVDRNRAAFCLIGAGKSKRIKMLVRR
jgi:hypothetical protein